MSKQNDLMEITDILIGRLNDENAALQKEALHLSAAHEFDKLGPVLKKQQEVIGALVATAEAAAILAQRGR